MPFRESPVDKKNGYIQGRRARFVFYLLAFIFLIWFISGYVLTALGHFLIRNDNPSPVQATVVLATGVDYYPRLIEAAELYKNGLVDRVIINGNRKTDVLRKLEAMGFEPVVPWYANSFRILKLLGVPRRKLLAISAEDAYDTVSEAKIVGAELLKQGVSRIIITTSKYHTRRAGYIWEHVYPDQFKIFTVAATSDPFDPDDWWYSGRQIRWVLAEYGAWLFYLWKAIMPAKL